MKLIKKKSFRLHIKIEKEMICLELLEEKKSIAKKNIHKEGGNLKCKIRKWEKKYCY
jgi:hypothetical protein